MTGHDEPVPAEKQCRPVGSIMMADGGEAGREREIAA
jgi:hypothetical protein